MVKVRFKIGVDYVSKGGIVLDSSWNESMYYRRECDVVVGDYGLEEGDSLYVARLSMESCKQYGGYDECAGDGFVYCYLRDTDVLMYCRGGEWRCFGDYLVVSGLNNVDQSMFKEVGGVRLLLGQEKKMASNECVVKYGNGCYEVGDKLFVVNMSMIALEMEYCQKFGERLFRLNDYQVCMHNGEIKNGKVLIRPLREWVGTNGAMEGEVLDSALDGVDKGDTLVYSRMCESPIFKDGENLVFTEEDFIYFKL